MNSPDKAIETQLKNVQARTGKTLDELSTVVANSGLTKHGEIRAMLMKEFGLGYGDANTLTHYVLKSDGKHIAEAIGLAGEDVVTEIYSGAKAGLRPIHDALMAAIEGFGTFEVAPKKGYVSLRRKRQFAMITPATNNRVEVGINCKSLHTDERLIEMPAGSMCNYKVKVTQVDEVDEKLVGWIRQAYDNAG